MDARRRATLRDVVATFGPPDARSDSVTEQAAHAIDGIMPRRRAEMERLLDLLWLPMKGGDPMRATILNVLAHAPIERLRAGFAALKRLSLFLAYAQSEPGNENPTWARIGYPGPRHDAQLASSHCRLPLRVTASASAPTSSLSGAEPVAASWHRRSRAPANASSSWKPAAHTMRAPLLNAR